MLTRSLKMMAAALLGIAAAVPALTQTPQPLAPATGDPAQALAATPAAPSGSPQIDKQDVDAWLDGYIPYAIGRGDVAGAVVVVVKDGQVLTQRGYGYADVAARKPVDPATTMFRPGSVSKLFAWTAVMQQVEAGKIDLDADVNQYLDFKIPAYDGKPITMRQIMTHTAGFEEIIKGLILMDQKPDSLGDILKARIPERIFEPGTTPAYSNYATALAGYVVERVSGMPFDDYIERNIFQRLGMTHSSFRQPLPANLVPHMSKGYSVGSAKAGGYEVIGMSPAGALASSGADMAKFMIAHLNGGAPLLKPETAQQMYTAQNKSVPNLNQMALGFYESWVNGRRAIGHGGDTTFFHSALAIFPAEKVGIYISMNSSGKEGVTLAIRAALVEQFADRYFPVADARPPRELATAKEHAKMLVGTWGVSRTIHSSFASVIGLIGDIKVGLDEDGRPLIAGIPSLNGEPRKWIEVEPFVWQDAYGHERLAAQVVDGKIVRWSFGMVSPFMVWDRTPWHLDGAWLLPAFLFGLAVVLITALSWPVGAIARRRYGAALALTGDDRKRYRLVRGWAWLVLLALVLWVLAFTGLEDFEGHGSMDWLIYLAQVIGTVAFVGMFGLSIWNLWRTWKGGRGWFAKLWSVLLVVGSLFILWVALAFKLISFGAAF